MIYILLYLAIGLIFRHLGRDVYRQIVTNDWYYAREKPLKEIAFFLLWPIGTAIWIVYFGFWFLMLLVWPK